MTQIPPQTPYQALSQPSSQASARDWLALGREVLDVEIAGLVAVRDEIGQGFLDALAPKTWLWPFPTAVKPTS